MPQQSRAQASPTRPKGILKKTSKYDVPNASPASPRSPTAERTKEIAMQHARIAEDMKQAPLRALAALEELVDYPSLSTQDPMSPAPTDVREFKALLKDFQPTDYDDLVKERNINGKCGYALCPRPNRRGNDNSKYRILSNGGQFKVVSREEAEHWCSDACAEHALYTRLQLTETAVWERRGGEWTINLRGEKVQPAANTDIGEIGDGVQQLALERGEGSLSSFKKDLVMTGVQERDTADVKVEPPVPSQGHGAVDGYVPRVPNGSSRQTLRRPTLVEMLERAGLGDDSDDDIMDVI